MTPQFLSAVQAFALGAAPFTGSPQTVNGPYWQEVPPGTALPTCAYFPVGAPLAEWYTNATAVEVLRLQFSVWHTDNNLAFTYANQIKTRFTAAAITLTSGACLAALPSGDPYSVPVPPGTKSPEGNPVYHVVLDVRFRVTA